MELSISAGVQPPAMAEPRRLGGPRRDFSAWKRPPTFLAQHLCQVCLCLAPSPLRSAHPLPHSANPYGPANTHASPH